MNRTKPFYWVLAGVALGVGICWGIYTCEFPRDFKFHSPVPKFSKEEQSAIHNTICNAMMSVEDPESFYISHVYLGKDTITIELASLTLLQAGFNSNGTMVSTSTGFTKQVRFNRNFEPLLDRQR